MAARPSGEMQDSDLRDRVYSTLRHAGVVDRLKAQLREHMIRELKREHSGVGGVPQPSSTPLTPMQMAINSMVLEHLKTSDYIYTQSVFVPETGMNPKHIFKGGDILTAAGVDPNSDLYKRVVAEHKDKGGDSKGQGSLFYHLMKELVRMRSVDHREIETQTDSDASLDRKLAAIDDAFLVRAEWEKQAPNRTIEERMLKYQQECDERVKIEISTEVARIREAELSAVRLEESNKHRMELERVRADLDRVHAERIESLQRRENELITRYQEKEKQFERQSYDHRQQMLAEMEQLRNKESNLKRSNEIEARQAQLEKERLAEKDKILQERLTDIETLKEKLRRQSSDEMDRYKAELKRVHDSEMNALQSDRALFVDDKKQIEEKLKDHDKLVDVKNELHEKVLRAQAELEAAQQKHQTQAMEMEQLRKRLLQAQEGAMDETNQLNRTVAELRTTKDEVIRLKGELAEAHEQIRNRTGDAKFTVDKMSQQVAELREDLARERANHNNEMAFLREESRKAVHNERSAWRKQEQDWLLEKQKLTGRLEQEKQSGDAVARRLQEAELEMQSIRRELSESRIQNQQARTALDVELGSRYESSLNNLASIQRMAAGGYPQMTASYPAVFDPRASQGPYSAQQPPAPVQQPQAFEQPQAHPMMYTAPAGSSQFYPPPGFWESREWWQKDQRKKKKKKSRRERSSSSSSRTSSATSESSYDRKKKSKKGKRRSSAVSSRRSSKPASVDDNPVDEKWADSRRGSQGVGDGDNGRITAKNRYEQDDEVVVDLESDHSPPRKQSAPRKESDGAKPSVVKPSPAEQKKRDAAAVRIQAAARAFHHRRMFEYIKNEHNTELDDKLERLRGEVSILKYLPSKNATQKADFNRLVAYERALERDIRQAQSLRLKLRAKRDEERRLEERKRVEESNRRLEEQRQKEERARMATIMISPRLNLQKASSEGVGIDSSKWSKAHKKPSNSSEADSRPTSPVLSAAISVCGTCGATFRTGKDLKCPTCGTPLPGTESLQQSKPTSLSLQSQEFKMDAMKNLKERENEHEMKKRREEEEKQEREAEARRLREKEDEERHRQMEDDRQKREQERRDAMELLELRRKEEELRLQKEQRERERIERERQEKIRLEEEEEAKRAAEARRKEQEDMQRREEERKAEERRLEVEREREREEREKAEREKVERERAEKERQRLEEERRQREREQQLEEERRKEAARREREEVEHSRSPIGKPPPGPHSHDDGPRSPTRDQSPPNYMAKRMSRESISSVDSERGRSPSGRQDKASKKAAKAAAKAAKKAAKEERRMQRSPSAGSDRVSSIDVSSSHDSNFTGSEGPSPRKSHGIIGAVKTVGKTIANPFRKSKKKNRDGSSGRLSVQSSTDSIGEIDLDEVHDASRTASRNPSPTDNHSKPASEGSVPVAVHKDPEPASSGAPPPVEVARPHSAVQDDVPSPTEVGLETEDLDSSTEIQPFDDDTEDSITRRRESLEKKKKEDEERLEQERKAKEAADRAEQDRRELEERQEKIRREREKEKEAAAAASSGPTGFGSGGPQVSDIKLEEFDDDDDFEDDFDLDTGDMY